LIIPDVRSFSSDDLRAPEVHKLRFSARPEVGDARHKASSRQSYFHILNWPGKLRKRAISSKPILICQLPQISVRDNIIRTSNVRSCQVKDMEFNWHIEYILIGFIRCAVFNRYQASHLNVYPKVMSQRSTRSIMGEHKLYNKKALGQLF